MGLRTRGRQRGIRAYTARLARLAEWMAARRRRDSGRHTRMGLWAGPTEVSRGSTYLQDLNREERRALSSPLSIT